jgi:hypothetical protein
VLDVDGNAWSSRLAHLLAEGYAVSGQILSSLQILYPPARDVQHTAVAR